MPAVFSSLEQAAAAVSFTPLHTGRPLVVFFTGNHGASRIARNMLASIRRLRRPFPVLVIPADGEALRYWQEAAEADGAGGAVDERLNVLADGEVLGMGFESGQTSFRQDSYNRLTLLKWQTAARLLQLGYDAMVLDPDLVFLRDPFAYMEQYAPGNCSMTSASENGEPWSYRYIAERNGFHAPGKPQRTYLPICWNTGQSMFSAGNPDTLVAIDEFIRYAQAHLALPENNYDDQYWWNNYLYDMYDLQPGMADALLEGRCVDFVRNARVANGSETPAAFPRPRAFTTYPFHNRLFVSRLDWNDRTHHDTMLMPISIHYNWASNILGKIELMQEAGHWFLQER